MYLYSCRIHIYGRIRTSNGYGKESIVSFISGNYEGGAEESSAGGGEASKSGNVPTARRIRC